MENNSLASEFKSLGKGSSSNKGHTRPIWVLLKETNYWFIVLNGTAAL